jgi:single-stranded-DNA-specific exonuclease
MLREGQCGEQFRQWLEGLGGKALRLHIFSDSDADGLPAAAILLRTLRAAGFSNVTAEVRRKGESAFSPEVRERLGAMGLEALIVADLGSRDEPLLPGIPTLLLDHHKHYGAPPGAVLVSAYRETGEGEDAREIETTGLLAYRCAQAVLGPEAASPMLWLAGISLLSDLGDKAPFAELAEAKKVYGGGRLRDATSLLNAPRRSASGDASAALDLLMLVQSPRQLLESSDPPVVALRNSLLRDKAEVGEALAAARKQPPKFASKLREELGADLIAIRMDTPCQVHPLVAQQWRARFPKSVIFGVNTGFRPGWVHFSGRAPAGVNLVQWLARHRPEGADGFYGNGHDQAAGGALRTEIWNGFAREIGFGAEMQVVQERD